MNLSPQFYTGLVGKYLNGYGVESGDGSCQDHYNPEDWDEWHAVVADDSHETHYSIWDGDPLGDLAEYQVFGGGAPDWTQYQPQQLSSRAVDFIDNAVATTQPFFLYVAPSAPHLDTDTPDEDKCDTNWTGTGSIGQSNTISAPPPFDTYASYISLPQESEVPSFNEPNVSDKPDYIRGYNTGGVHHGPNPPMFQGEIDCTEQVYRDRLESMKPIDLLFGAIGARLALRGVLDNTVIIFTSDNGYYNGEHRLHEKIFPYEEGIRVPLVIRFKDSLDQDSDAHFIVNTDLAATIADLAGATTVGVDGQSFAQFLPGGGGGDWRYRLLLEHWNGEGDGYPNIPDFFGVRTIPTIYPGAADDAVYVQYDAISTFAAFEEYYLLGTDPSQLGNAIGMCSTTCDALGDYLILLKDCSVSTTLTCQDLENADTEEPPS